MNTTYCVWARVPRKNQSMAGRNEGWSRIAGNLTKEAAELFAEQVFFEARAMPDAMPGHTVPVTANPLDVTWEDDEELT